MRPGRVSFRITLLILLVNGVLSLDYNARISDFKKKYNNTRGDIVFMIESAESVKKSGFSVQKEFVSMLLNDLAVQTHNVRVSLFTYAHSADKNIDYILRDLIQKNRCTFNKDLEEIKFLSGQGRNAYEVFNQGRYMIDEAIKYNVRRNNINTTFVFITDGPWSSDPVPVTGVLRSDPKYMADIIAVGVGQGLETTLSKITGSIDNVIITADFSELQKLSVFKRGDDVEKQFELVPSDRCTALCDSKAVCSCGTTSGHYACACLAGFYGSGLVGDCRPCPPGTYKDMTNTDTSCKPCPSNSYHTKLGSTSKQDCTCIDGFTGLPFFGGCQKVTCPPLVPTKGGVLSNCGKNVGETCIFECEDGYRHPDQSNRQMKLTCLSSGRWSDTVPICEAVSCPTLRGKSNIDVSCSGNYYRSTCMFSCHAGFTLKGSASTLCNKDGVWSSPYPVCEAVYCPPHSPVAAADVVPNDCVHQPSKANSICSFKCQNGYSPPGQYYQRFCQNNGNWSGTELVCTDISPPIAMKCESIQVFSAEPGVNFARAMYVIPVFVDNGELVSGNSPAVTFSPSYAGPGYSFPIGRTEVVYQAKDSSNNIGQCVIYIIVEDHEPPEFTLCPDDISVYESGPITLVEWPQPSCLDNSGTVELISMNTTQNKASFSLGHYRIEYRALDLSRNIQTCQFMVSVRPAVCEAEAPSNGALTCKNFGGRSLCTISCQSPYQFLKSTSATFRCMDMMWKSMDARLPVISQTKPWPDCGILKDTDGARQVLNFVYYAGSCFDEAVREKIKELFAQRIKDLLVRYDVDCSSVGGVENCAVDNADVFCGTTQSHYMSTRLRRSGQAEIYVMVDVKVKAKDLTFNSSETMLNKLVGRLMNETGNAGRTGYELSALSVDSDVLTLSRSSIASSAKPACREGEVYEETKYSCHSCPPGEYYDKSTVSCMVCPRGTYSEYDGSLSCIKCQNGLFTQKEGAKSKSSCKPICQPGWYSSTGVGGCKACPLGQYQDEPMSTSCVPCPGGSTTVHVGAKSEMECASPCSAGSYSYTGVEPCSLCYQGYFQEKSAQVSCKVCPQGMSTLSEGSSSASMCTAVNFCASSPCLNGGMCTNQGANFTCKCSQGYYGQRCEFEINECENRPCYGDSACVDQVNGFTCVCPTGYGGPLCRDKLTSCTQRSCLNGGVCMETSDSFKCVCPLGYSGKYCESIIDVCERSPCKNDGKCVSYGSLFECICSFGFAGKLCEETIDRCSHNNLCANGRCVSGPIEHACVCNPGFAGKRCEVDMDDCASSPCMNNGQCEDKINSYQCHCAPGYDGNNCENSVSDLSYELLFEKKQQLGYTYLPLSRDLTELTIAFWMKASADIIDPSSVLSYAVQGKDRLFDNALSLRDYKSFMFSIMNEEVETLLRANDDDWHHVALTWESSQGQWKAFRDGNLISSGDSLAQGKIIPRGGDLFLGQEQDDLGRNFSASEAFVGSLSQLNIWSIALSNSEILAMSQFRCDSVQGNVMSWDRFKKNIYGEVAVKNEFCSEKPVRYSAWVSATPNLCSGVCMLPRHLQATVVSPVARPTTADTKYRSWKMHQALPVEVGLPSNQLDVRCLVLGNGIQECPSMQIRCACVFTPADSCASGPCKNGGHCSNTLSGFQCTCQNGFKGKSCEVELSCPPITSITQASISMDRTSPGTTVTVTCLSGYRLVGASTLTCQRGKWSSAMPSCVDIDECATSVKPCRNKCYNTVGSYFCEPDAGHQITTSDSDADINECLVRNGNCQHQCTNTKGSFYCSCPGGYKLASNGIGCEDMDECSEQTHNCHQQCINIPGSFQCTCFPGFIMAANAQCIGVSCKEPAPLQNGKVSAGLTTYIEMVSFSCNDGYRLNGLPTRTCQANGQWSGVTPTCEVVQCLGPQSPQQGTVSTNGNSYGSVAMFSCNPGYTIVGDQRRTCSKSGHWSGTQPRCLPFDCKPFQAPANGFLVGSQFMVNSVVFVRCNPGYLIDSPAGNFRVCMMDGSWSGQDAQCLAVNCGSPGPIDKGSVTFNSTNHGAMAVYSCNPSYGLIGEQTRVCELNGAWSGTAPTCSLNSCGTPGDVVNGVRKGKLYTFGKSVTYSCNNGYQLVGATTLRCLTSGKWSEKAPECQPVNCGDPGTPPGSDRSLSSTTFMGTVRYRCPPGYRMDGSSERTCQENRTWSGIAPSCLISTCGGFVRSDSGVSLMSPNYPSSYLGPDYCRWRITVPADKLASISFSDFKLEPWKDYVILADGKTDRRITKLSGMVPSGSVFTSSSNMIDVLFTSDETNQVAVSGFSANHFSSVCGGLVTEFGSVIESPNFSTGNFMDKISCVWTVRAEGPTELHFESFNLGDSMDYVVVYKSASRLDGSSFLGHYTGYYGSVLLTYSSVGEFYVRYVSTGGKSSRGFRARVNKSFVKVAGGISA